MTIEELIQKYRNAMTEEPSTVNHYCNMFIRDLQQLQSENDELKQENEQYKEKIERVFRVAYNETKLTETTKKTLVKMAELLDIEL